MGVIPKHQIFRALDLDATEVSKPSELLFSAIGDQRHRAVWRREGRWTDLGKDVQG